MQGAWAALTRKLCTICLALCQEHGCWPFFSLLCSSIAHFLAVSRMTGGGGASEPPSSMPHLPCPLHSGGGTLSCVPRAFAGSCVTG